MNSALDQTTSSAPSELEPAPPAVDQQQALALLASLQADPFAAQKLEWMRKEVFNMISNLVREVAGMIPLDSPANGDAGQKQLQANSVLALRTLSRQLESAGRERQDLAQQIVMGTLLNRNNPDWNPLDPSTDRSSRDSLIIALMQPPQTSQPANEQAG